MTELARRTLIAAALGAFAMPRLAFGAPATGTVKFAIVRNGKQPFGNAQITYVTNGDLLTVTSDVNMAAKVAGLNVFEYSHHCEEVWRGPNFVEMRSRTIRDKGKSVDEAITATKTADDVRVVTKRDRLSLPRDARPFTHWNNQAIQGQLFNPQDGSLLLMTAKSLGRSPVTLASGAKLDANRWAMRDGKQSIDEWYDETGAWVGLTSYFPDKSIVEYRKV